MTTPKIGDACMRYVIALCVLVAFLIVVILVPGAAAVKSANILFPVVVALLSCALVACEVPQSALAKKTPVPSDVIAVRDGARIHKIVDGDVTCYMTTYLFRYETAISCIRKGAQP